MAKTRLAETSEPNTAAPEPVKSIGEATAKKQPKIHPSRFHLDAHAHNEWAAHPPQGTSIEEILDPSYFAHIAEFKLRPNDKIKVYPADNTYYAELIVRSCGKQFANVALLRKVDLGEMPAMDSVQHQVLWLDPQNKWAVVRSSDKAMMQGGFDTQAQATHWLAINARSLAA